MYNCKIFVPRLMRTRTKLQSIHCFGHKHFKFDLNRKLLKLEPNLMTWLPNGKIEKTRAYLLFSLFFQFTAIKIRWVFSHAKLMISSLQWLEIKAGCPCSLVSYSHFSTDIAQYQDKSSMFSMCACTSACQWHHKLCAVRMRNAKQGNDLKVAPYSFLSARALISKSRDSASFQTPRQSRARDHAVKCRQTWRPNF